MFGHQNNIPNITGWAGDFRFKTTGSPFYGGAFDMYTKDGEALLASANTSNSSTSNRISFYASNSSSVYSSSKTTVQPSAIQTLMIIKT